MTKRKIDELARALISCGRQPNATPRRPGRQSREAGVPRLLADADLLGGRPQPINSGPGAPRGWRRRAPATELEQKVQLLIQEHSTYGHLWTSVGAAGRTWLVRLTAAIEGACISRLGTPRSTGPTPSVSSGTTSVGRTSLWGTRALILSGPASATCSAFCTNQRSHLTNSHKYGRIRRGSLLFRTNRVFVA